MDPAEPQTENVVDQTEEEKAEICINQSTPRSTDAYDIFGEPQAHPRLGDMYQVEIPCFMMESNLFQEIDDLVKMDYMHNDSYLKAAGLPIPIIYQEQGYPFPATSVDKTESTKSFSYTGNGCNDLNRCSFKNKHGPFAPSCGVEFTDENKEHLNDFATGTSQKCSTENDDKQVVLHLLQQKESQYYCPLPVSAVTSWTDAESKSFLLGLYIFGKNLIQIRNFVEVKNMSDILSFYYGKFYRSGPYKRWSECRKTRRRRCIFGQRIFTGWRQQELLSRLLPCCATEVQEKLLEATRSFNEGKDSLEDFVFTLKAMLGMEKLVEAIGIGKGKHDITGIILDPVRTNCATPMRPELPIGKACSSLTSGDIIKFLTGDFRLSKARSNDLFWEAVWPRLLAKGWHSEQPLDLVSVGSKNTLVFLVPGIKKFSRKRLVKGDQYFDSVSDVLNRVASDPNLIEVEGLKDNGAMKEESGAELKANKVRASYLQPKVTNFSAKRMKFTVVDTSMFHGDTPFKVREVRSLPVDTISNYVPPEIPEKLDSDSSEEDSVDTANEIEGKIQPGPVISLNNEVATEEEANLSNHPMTSSEPLIPLNGYDSDEQNISNTTDPLDDDVKPHKLNYLSPAPKRPRLTDCKHVGSEKCTSSIFRNHKLQKEEFEHKPDISITTDNKVAKAEKSQKIERLGHDESTNGFSDDFLNEKEVIEIKKAQPLSFDLNLPHCPTEFDASASNATINQSSSGSLRHSTRSRPLTTKALEAFECGYLTAGLRRKGVRTNLFDNLEERPSRRARRSARSPTDDVIS